jgi:cytochrome c biogenesis protein
MAPFPRSSSRKLLDSWYELLSSMRFAVALLTVLLIASIIGTVLRQDQTQQAQQVEFGPFWYRVFYALDLFDVYHAAWFILILAFLVLSTSLCILRNARGFWREMTSFKTQVTEQSLPLMKHHAQISATEPTEKTVARLAASGWQSKIVTREDGSILIAAKKGSANKWGYFAAHGAIVLICLGGLIDGNIIQIVQRNLGFIAPETRPLFISQVPEKSRLAENNLSFRADVQLSEGQQVSAAFLNTSDGGYYVQDLPFILKLNQFLVEYYDSGQPKLFASNIDVTDKATGVTTKNITVKVNEPYRTNGIAIYQASFGDGGSGLTFKAWPLHSPTLVTSDFSAKSRSQQPFTYNGISYQLELGEFRAFNIEDISAQNTEPKDALDKTMTDVRNVRTEKTMKNVGPSITFKLRDPEGQAVEMQHFMSPITVDGDNYLRIAVRKDINAPFEYLHLPLDADFKIDRFMAFNAALKSPQSRAKIAQQLAARNGAGNAILQTQLEQTTLKLLSVFSEGGFPAIVKTLEQDTSLSAEKREALTQSLVAMLRNASVDIMNVADQQAGRKPLENTADNYAYLLRALIASSTLNDYPAPVYLQLTGFTHVQESGFQMTRSPGKTWVYFGSLLLVLGIMLMFYVRDKRLWIIQNSSFSLIGMSAARDTYDLDQAFEHELAYWHALAAANLAPSNTTKEKS